MSVRGRARFDPRSSGPERRREDNFAENNQRSSYHRFRQHPHTRQGCLARYFGSYRLHARGTRTVRQHEHREPDTVLRTPQRRFRTTDERGNGRVSRTFQSPRKREKRKVKELSKGNQQKVQIISTLVHEPELVILDEPFSGFDPINGMLLQELIDRLHARGTTIILSSHNMHAVETMCSHIALRESWPYPR